MEDVIENLKVCKDCQQNKEISLFPKSPGMKDGHLNSCKNCNKDKRRKRLGREKREIRTFFDKQTKICTDCRIEKPFEEFYPNKNIKDGIDIYCKNCETKQRRTRLKQKERPQTIFYEEKTKVCCSCKEKKPFEDFSVSKNTKSGRGTICLPCLKEYQKEHYKENSDKLKQKSSEYYSKNKEKCLERQKEYGKNNRIEINKRVRFRLRNDLNFSLNHRISSLIKQSLKNKSKRGRHWETLVGFTTEELKSHLEKQFTQEMVWGGVLNGKIWIDHILPRDLFEYETPDDPQFKACWALSNLQPLWKQDNINKSDFLPDGRRTRNLSKQEKLEYLRGLGYNF